MNVMASKGIVFPARITLDPGKESTVTHEFERLLSSQDMLAVPRAPNVFPSLIWKSDVNLKDKRHELLNDVSVALVDYEIARDQFNALRRHNDILRTAHAQALMHSSSDPSWRQPYNDYRNMLAEWMGSVSTALGNVDHAVKALKEDMNPLSRVKNFDGLTKALKRAKGEWEQTTRNLINDNRKLETLENAVQRHYGDWPIHGHQESSWVVPRAAVPNNRI